MRIENGYIVFRDDEIKKHKKITGHSFVQLCGRDKYTLKGDCVLERMGIIENESIDPFYTKRGNLAEFLVLKSYKKKGYNCVTFNPQSIKYDNFPQYELFGGMIDILVKGNTQEEDFTIEVKSKSTSMYEKISSEGNMAEEFQGAYYAVLQGQKKFVMEWVFFPPEIESLIRQDVKVTDFKGIKNFSYVKEIDEGYYAIITKLIQYAVSYYDDCYYNKRVPLADVSEKVKRYLIAVYNLGVE